MRRLDDFTDLDECMHRIRTLSGELEDTYQHLREMYEDIHKTDIFEENCHLKKDYEKGIDEIESLIRKNDRVINELMKLHKVCDGKVLL